MPSLDTNILLRIILLDNEVQLAKVKRLLKKHNEFAVSDQTIVEVVYSIGGYYEYTREEVAGAIQRLMDNQHINMNRALFERVLPNYIEHRGVSFTDCCLEAYATLNKQTPLYTIDKKLANQLPHAELIK